MLIVLKATALGPKSQAITVERKQLDDRIHVTVDGGTLIWDADALEGAVMALLDILYPSGFNVRGQKSAALRELMTLLNPFFD